MARVASLFLPQLAIERLRRNERSRALPERAAPLQPVDDPGTCWVPRDGGWRPGARWARDGKSRADVAAEAAMLPLHQRPPGRELGRRSEPAPPPFRGSSLRTDPAAVPAPAPTIAAAPLVLVAAIGQRQVITAACPAALALGLSKGMAATQARALVVDLDVRPADPDADQALLDRLALHAVLHWTPIAAPIGDGLWLDLTGTTHLFGGEEQFCRRVRAFCARLGLTARIAVAGTPGAANALARFAREPFVIVPPGGEVAAIAPLPLAALRIEPGALAAAGRFGLERVADLLPMPRGPLARRLGLASVERLDQAIGRIAEPIVPVLPFEAPTAERRLLEPIATAEAIATVIRDVVEDLVDVLRTRGLGARAVELTAARVDGVDQRLTIGTSRATRDAAHLTRMFAMRIERIDPGLGIEAVRIVAVRAAWRDRAGRDAGRRRQRAGPSRHGRSPRRTHRRGGAVPHAPGRKRHAGTGGRPDRPAGRGRHLAALAASGAAARSSGTALERDRAATRRAATPFLVARRYPRDFAERTFKQIEGFGSYGFPERHAASFAKIAYASCWMKHHHPDVFCASLLNAQPMGFYAPAQVVGDARNHGVEIRPVCINASRWDCTLEPGQGRYLAVRLGFRQVSGLANIHGATIVAERGVAPFRSVEEVWRRSGVPRSAIERLAEADAFLRLGEDRRRGLWKVRGLGEAPLPLFVAADEREAAFSPEGVEPSVALRPMTDGREVVEDYRSLQLSLRAHPLTFLRDELTRAGVVRCADLAGLRDGRRVKVAGLILVRQKPGSAKGVLFITIEDETGVANGILWPDRFEAQRRTVMSAHMVTLAGRVQREGEVIHVIIDTLTDEAAMLSRIGGMAMPHSTGRGDGARHSGAPDRGDPGWRPRDSYWPLHAEGMDPEAVLRVKTRDFR